MLYCMTEVEDRLPEEGDHLLTPTRLVHEGCVSVVFLEMII